MSRAAAGETKARHGWRLFVPGLVVAGAGVFGLFVLLFEVLRLAMLLRNRDLADSASVVPIAHSFLTGLRFDMAVAAYAVGPLLLLALGARAVFGRSAERRTLEAGAGLLGFLVVFGGLAELEFYREFYARYNLLSLQYWSHPGTVASMIWHGYPVVRYALVGAALFTVWLLVVHRLVRGLDRESPIARPGPRIALVRASMVTPAVLVLAVAARGGVRGRPLQWGDATFGDSVFANALAQNGFWTLGSSVVNALDKRKAAETWPEAFSHAEAHRRAQRLLVTQDEELVGDGSVYPLLRRTASRRPAANSISGVPAGAPHENDAGGWTGASAQLASTSTHGSSTAARQEAPSAPSVSLRTAPGRTPPNVVLILMESFSARYVGAVGSHDDRTPEFDKLASRGILFDRAFSNGSHTDQAAYCATTSFPNLPGYESLMQTIAGSQRFDSLAGALASRGYRTYFLYNGDLAWDNMRGFFRGQRIDVLLGLDDFDRSGFVDPTWGVSDQELFDRAAQEFRAARAPFFGLVLTLSNHTPFDLPRPLPFPETTDAGRLNDRMNGVRYADWAIGRFFESASREPWFKNTLFVLVADHGFSVPPILTDLNLLRFHVPLLFYAPDLLGETPRVRHTVASHVDIAPTVLGLLGDTTPHQHWGRNLFALPDDDSGFAIFKPAGGVDEVGYAHGDRLLVRDASGRATLYRYDLGFPPGLVRIETGKTGQQADRIAKKTMEDDLQAYVQTAREVLAARHVAPEPSAER